jgi:hypothetical protein
VCSFPFFLNLIVASNSQLYLLELPESRGMMWDGFWTWHII